jgi:hypothetical protein
VVLEGPVPQELHDLAVLRRDIDGESKWGVPNRERIPMANEQAVDAVMRSLRHTTRESPCVVAREDGFAFSCRSPRCTARIERRCDKLAREILKQSLVQHQDGRRLVVQLA